MQILKAKKFNAIVQQYTTETTKKRMTAIAKAIDRRYASKIKEIKGNPVIKALVHDVAQHIEKKESETEDIRVAELPKLVQHKSEVLKQGV